MSTTTFDEFRAMNRRAQAVGGNAEKSTSSKPIASLKQRTGSKTSSEDVVSKSKALNSPDLKKKTFLSSFFDNVGMFLEMHHMQAFYIFLLLVDLICSLLHLYLAQMASVENSVLVFNKTIAFRVTELCLTFCTFFFVAEMICVLVTFKFSVSGHVGYLTDIVTIAVQIYLESEGHGVEAHALCFFRFWRLIRLFNSLLTVEKDAHDRTIAKLELVEEALRKANFERDNFEIAVEKEKEARNSVETMLTSYKEEVDTLNEALKIAAMDIAEVAEADEDILDSDEEDNGNDEDNDVHAAAVSARARVVAKDAGRIGMQSARTVGQDDDDEFEDAIGSKYSKSANKEVLMRAVMEDARQGGAGPTGSRSQGSSTYFVHEDGSFEQK